MPGRLPTCSDFPPHLSLDIIPPPASHKPVNVLLLFHGLGDTKASFTNFGKQIALPETVCISLQGPTPLPFGLAGYHWGDDITFNQSTCDMDYDTGFTKMTNIMTTIKERLVDTCGYQPREIFMLGLGQGGMTALGTLASLKEELGGAISIGGRLPSTSTLGSDSSSSKNRTPILVLGGSSQSCLTPDAISKLKAAFEFLDYKKWPLRSGDGMPRNREEMLPIMHFFSRHLRSRRGVPEGSVEIG